MMELNEMNTRSWMRSLLLYFSFRAQPVTIYPASSVYLFSYYLFHLTKLITFYFSLSFLYSAHSCLFPSVLNTFHSFELCQNIEDNCISGATDYGFLVCLWSWAKDCSFVDERWPCYFRLLDFLIYFWIIKMFRRKKSYLNTGTRDHCMVF